MRRVREMLSRLVEPPLTVPHEPQSAMRVAKAGIQSEHRTPRGLGPLLVPLREREPGDEVVRLGLPRMPRGSALRDARCAHEVAAREQRLCERQEDEAPRIRRQRLAHRVDVVTGHRAPPARGPA